MASPALNHLLRTLAAVPIGQRVLLRGSATEGLARPLAQMGFEVHAGTWTDAAARHVQEAFDEEAGSKAERQEKRRDPGRAAPVYATAAPLRTLPYPEAHFGWVVARPPAPEGSTARELREGLQALLEEARHHVRPGGWVYVLAPAAEDRAPVAFTSAMLNEAAQQATLAKAEAPARAEGRGRAVVHAIYRRVEKDTPV